MLSLNNSKNFKKIDGPVVCVVMDGIGIGGDNAGNAAPQGSCCVQAQGWDG